MEHYQEFKSVFQKLNPAGKIDDEVEKLLQTMYTDLQKLANSLVGEKQKKTVEFSKVLTNEIFYTGNYKFVKIDEQTGQLLEVLKKSGKSEEKKSKILKRFDMVEFHKTNRVDIFIHPG